jgi:hypothetical protein
MCTEQVGPMGPKQVRKGTRGAGRFLGQNCFDFNVRRTFAVLPLSLLATSLAKLKSILFVSFARRTFHN